MRDRSVMAMTNETWLQGIEHGWVQSISRTDAPARRRASKRERFRLSEWLPTAIRARGGESTRDGERLYSDLQAARDARESGR